MGLWMAATLLLAGPLAGAQMKRLAQLHAQASERAPVTTLERLARGAGQDGVVHGSILNPASARARAR
jgi:hypothetical protein